MAVLYSILIEVIIIWTQSQNIWVEFKPFVFYIGHKNHNWLAWKAVPEATSHKHDKIT